MKIHGFPSEPHLTWLGLCGHFTPGLDWPWGGRIGYANHQWGISKVMGFPNKVIALKTPIVCVYLENPIVGTIDSVL